MIAYWGARNLVKLNVFKTQPSCLPGKWHTSLYPILGNGQALILSDLFMLMSLMIWYGYIVDLTVGAVFSIRSA